MGHHNEGGKSYEQGIRDGYDEGYDAGVKDSNREKEQLEQQLTKAESHSRQLWLEAAEIAGLWARSHSCNSHDNNPCCHVRTGAEIAKRLRAKAESIPKPSPALPTQENL